MLDSTWKKFTSKVKMTFDGSNTYEATGSTKVMQVDVKKELSNSNTDPLGVVSANTISVKLLDVAKEFIKGNTGSPYFGLLKEGFKIEYFIAIDDGAFNNAGVFYATDIKNTQNSSNYNTATISGADILQYIGNTPVNIVGVKQGQTVKQYFESIFANVGLNSGQYNVASTLTQTIKYTYAFGIKLKDILNSLAKSYMCNVYVDDNGVIQVVDLLALALLTTKNFEFDGNINTFETVLGTNLLDTYNSVKITYSNPTLIKSDKLLSVSNFDIPVGTTTLSEFVYGDGKKAVNLDYINLYNGVNDTLVTIDTISSTQNSVILTVTNSYTEPIKVSIDIYGGSINENNAVIEKYVTGISEDKRKYLEVEAKLIQTDSYASSYATVLLKYLSSDISYITLKTKGNPLLKLADIVGVTSDWLHFDGTCIISSIKLSLGSSYTCNITVLNSAALQ